MPSVRGAKDILIEIASHGGYALSWPGPERPERALYRHETTAGLCLACYVSHFRILLLDIDFLTVITGTNTRRKSLPRVSDTSDYRTNGIFYSAFDRTPCIRPLIEDFWDTTVPPTLILRYLDDDALRALNKQRLTRLEMKYVAKRVLEALAVLHDEGFVHTGMLHL
jgi:hypothetical protein